MSATYSEIGSDKNANEFLKKLADEIKNNPPTDMNNGHNNLMDDLAQLSYDAYHYEFHDFKNTKYAAPKIILREKLLEMAKNVEDGRYDN